jgi:hypothetical protein
MRDVCELPREQDFGGAVPVPLSCPSLACAEEVGPLVEECAASIAQLPDAKFFRELEQSAMLAECRQLDQVRKAPSWPRSWANLNLF